MIGKRQNFSLSSKGIYSSDNTEMTYSAMLREARDHLDMGESVAPDGTFRRREDRAAMLDAVRVSNAFSRSSMRLCRL